MRLCGLTTDLHLLTPWFEDPANHGSRMKMHLQVSQRLTARSSAGLSDNLETDDKVIIQTHCFAALKQ